jgi:hypothetical protein
VRESSVFNSLTIYGELNSRAVTEHGEIIAELHKAEDKLIAIVARMPGTNQQTQITGSCLAHAADQMNLLNPYRRLSEATALRESGLVT